MGERTSHPAGAFSWAELSTNDAEAAKAFYTGLFGWDVEDTPAGPDMNYTMARLGGKEVAAMYQQGEREQGVPPNWHSYVTVESADDAAARAKELGAELLGDGAFDVMDVGRMAIIQDPTGAMIFAWEPRKSIGATRVNDPGSLTWNDLGTRPGGGGAVLLGAVRLELPEGAGAGRLLDDLERRPRQRRHAGAGRPGGGGRHAAQLDAVPSASSSEEGRGEGRESSAGGCWCRPAKCRAAGSPWSGPPAVPYSRCPR